MRAPSAGGEVRRAEVWASGSLMSTDDHIAAAGLTDASPSCCQGSICERSPLYYSIEGWQDDEAPAGVQSLAEFAAITGGISIGMGIADPVDLAG